MTYLDVDEVKEVSVELNCVARREEHHHLHNRAASARYPQIQK